MSNEIRLSIAIACASTLLFTSAQSETTSAQGQANPIKAPITSIADASSTALVLSIQGVRSNKGSIRAALLKADPVAGVARNSAGKVMIATEGTLTMRFENLVPGEYAVQLFHDENDNGEMDSNLFGIPLEGFGFSNDARASFGPPKFAQMKVSVGTTPVQTTATITY
jgi:uncharacterized protein (DUF2141 family)